MPASVEINVQFGRFRRIYTNLLMDAAFDDLSEGAECLWHRFLLIADDFGNYLADPLLILAAAGPRRRGWSMARVKKLMAELRAADLLLPYAAGGLALLHARGFCALQPPNKHGKRFRKFPPSEWEAEEGQNGLFRGKRGAHGGPDTEPETDPETEAESERRTGDGNGGRGGGSEGEGGAGQGGPAADGRRASALAPAPDAGPESSGTRGAAARAQLRTEHQELSTAHPLHPQSAIRNPQCAKSPVGFVNVGILRLCEAFRFNQDESIRQRRSLAALLHTISEHPQREMILAEWIALAKEKRADARVDRPVAAWMAAIKKGMADGHQV